MPLLSSLSQKISIRSIQHPHCIQSHWCGNLIPRWRWFDWSYNLLPGENILSRDLLLGFRFLTPWRNGERRARGDRGPDFRYFSSSFVSCFSFSLIVYMYLEGWQIADKCVDICVFWRSMCMLLKTKSSNVILWLSGFLFFAHLNTSCNDCCWLRYTRNGFQKLEKIKDSSRQSRQLEELTEKMRDCKRYLNLICSLAVFLFFFFSGCCCCVHKHKWGFGVRSW